MDSYFVKMQPRIDTSQVKKLKTEVNKINPPNLSFGGVGGLARIGGMMLGVGSAVALVSKAFSTLSQNIKDGISYLDDFVAKSDQISTLAKDVNLSSVETLALMESLKTLGINDEMQAKMFSNIRESIASGGLVNFEDKNIIQQIDDLVRQYGTALKNKDLEKQAEIFKILGVRGKQMELLGSGVNLETLTKKTIREYEKSTGLNKTALNQGIERGAGLEEKQTQKIEREKSLNLLKTGVNKETTKNVETITKTKILEQTQSAKLTQAEGFNQSLELNYETIKTMNGVSVGFQSGVNEFVGGVKAFVKALDPYKNIDLKSKDAGAKIKAYNDSIYQQNQKTRGYFK